MLEACAPPVMCVMGLLWVCTGGGGGGKRKERRGDEGIPEQ